ncbi:hypothetical protein EDB19DRAFT_1897202 [Suillus lakei]|nr:hypothetical protein EDB19DRAFT_1897202 [Suillus lakei]
MTIALDYGAMLVGGLLAFGLSGCVNMQFIVYCRVYFRERWHIKRISMEFRLLDLCHSALVAGALWDSIIATYGDLDKFDTISWYPTIELTAMTTLIVQSFFAYRIYRLQKKRLTVAIPIVVMASSKLSLQSYSAFFQAIDMPIGFSWIFTLGLLFSALVDIMITTFITIRIIDTLTFWTIQNGSMTSLNARKQIWNGKQHTPTNDQPMPIIFLEDFEHAPESSIMRQEPSGNSREIWFVACHVL